MKKQIITQAVLFFLLLVSTVTIAQETGKIYLSGMGSDDMQQWQFYCTNGMNAGKWTSIGVPSCWEFQGFGKYNYGFAKDSSRGKENGLYKHQFKVPASWKAKVINIVFEGVMTDAEVKINGKSAGPIHQGAFYAFKYDISKLLKYGKDNLLEVTVAKHSANKSVNEAERKADFWIFGGIFRPVWLEVLPQQHMEHVSIDAKADGSFKAEIDIADVKEGRIETILYDASKQKLTSFNAFIHSSTQKNIVAGQINNPRLWSAEFPNLYEAHFTLYDGDKAVHSITKKFGFRTVEVTPRDGIYVNGAKMKFKGVNRHSFWPTSGRTTSRQISINDVLLMKSMNMNAARMSHYPPDDHFLEVCDSLGLYVMDELAGWHGNYDTPTGTKLLKEMIDHDVNHPSIVMWSNGNEGGHNFELDSLFGAYDIQDRPVVHPWQLFNGIETQHYREYNYGIGNYNHGHDIVMPTEFLHGLYDGGHGAGLEDYWNQMWNDPLSAGGFLWDFSDQGVVRKDLHDSLDTDGNHAADGIVGPYHEKEGSYFAIKEIWSPVHPEPKEITKGFDGKINVENQYQFTNLSQCVFTWKLEKLYPKNSLINYPALSGVITSPSIAPAAKGQLQVPLATNWSSYDVLYVSAYGPDKKELFTWSFPIAMPADVVMKSLPGKGAVKPVIAEVDSLYKVSANGVEVWINKNNGILQKVINSKGNLPFNNGPVLQEGVNNFAGFTHHFEGNELIIASTFDRKKSYNKLRWTVYPYGWVKMEVQYFPSEYFTSFDGVNFSFPENEMKSVTYMGDGPYRVWKNRTKGTQFGIWNKTYNNTETGEWPWVYPEFKGYHANMYWCNFFGKNNSFSVITPNEDLYLRLFTPKHYDDQWHNYQIIFPTGDISFMQGIGAIGSKTQRNETTGPMGSKNIFYDYEKDPDRALNLTLYFDFSGNELK